MSFPCQGQRSCGLVTSVHDQTRAFCQEGEILESLASPRPQLHRCAEHMNSLLLLPDLGDVGVLSLGD